MTGLARTATLNGAVDEPGDGDSSAPPLAEPRPLLDWVDSQYAAKTHWVDTRAAVANIQVGKLGLPIREQN